MDTLPRHPGIGSPTSLIRCETDNPNDFAAVFFFPSGAAKAIVAPTQGVPIEPTLDAAKEYVTGVIDTLLAAGLTEDIERTNIASLVAATQRLIDDFNQALRNRIYQ